MRKYKKLNIPLGSLNGLEKMNEKIQKIYCVAAIRCDVNCDDCLYGEQHLKLFVEWYKKKK